MSQADYKSCGVGRVSNYASLLILSAFPFPPPSPKFLECVCVFMKIQMCTERESYQVVNTTRVPANGWEQMVSRRLESGPQLPQPRARPSPPLPSAPIPPVPVPPAPSVPSRPFPLRRGAPLTYFPRISSHTARSPPSLRGSKAFNPWESSEQPHQQHPAPAPQGGRPPGPGRGGGAAGAERGGLGRGAGRWRVGPGRGAARPRSTI